MKFRVYLDKVTNRLTCFGIFNALLIFSLGLPKTKISIFLSAIFIILSLLVLYSIIEEFFQQESETDFNSSVDLGQYFIFIVTMIFSFIGFSIYSIIVFPLFAYVLSIVLGLITGSEILQIGGEKSVLRRLSNKQKSNTFYKIVGLCLILVLTAIFFFLYLKVFHYAIHFLKEIS